MDEVAMGSLLSPVIATLFRENFKEVALSGAVYKTYCWFCYIDDNLMMSCDSEMLKDPLEYLNSIHHNIQFTMETGTDVNVYRRQHFSFFFSFFSHFNPANKSALPTLAHRAVSKLNNTQ
jgi:hypothetical protein